MIISPTTSNKSSFAQIYSTAAAYGNHYTTDQVLAALLHQQRHNPSFEVEFATLVLTKCGYTKHSFVLPLQDIFRRLTREEYLELRHTHLVDLAERACVEALGRWGGDRSEVTHLFWGTMTGAMDSPTIDILLAKVCVCAAYELLTCLSCIVLNNVIIPYLKRILICTISICNI